MHKNKFRLPINKDVSHIQDDDGAYIQIIHPLGKYLPNQCCSDCKHMVGYASWWCENNSAVRYYGTAIPSREYCIYWEPCKVSFKHFSTIKNTLTFIKDLWTMIFPK